MKLSVKPLMLVILLLLIALPTQIFAQEPTLTEGELANVEKALAGLDTISGYASYIAAQTDITGSTIIVSADGQEILNQEENSLESYTYTLINGDTPNLSGFSNIINNTIENGTETTFMLDAELRVVDSEAYVNASYSTLLPGDTSTLPALPEGWTTVTEAELETYPGLEAMSFDKIFAITENGGPVPFVLEFDRFAEAVRGAAVEVLETTMTLPDGTEGDAILISLAGENFGQLALSDPEAASNPLVMAIVENLTADSAGFLSVTFDSAGNVVQVGLTLNFITGEIDGQVVSEQLPAGSIVTIELVNSSTVDFSGINETYTPAEVPAE